MHLMKVDVKLDIDYELPSPGEDTPSRVQKFSPVLCLYSDQTSAMKLPSHILPREKVLE